MPSLEDKIRWNQERARTDDPVDFYNAQYPHLDRGQLRREDRKLYDRLWRDGLLKVVPTSKKYGDNHIAYYKKKYAGISRGQLREKDPSLYQMLWRDGTLERVPKKSSKSL
ncbi:MAG: hypothetical protein Q7K45_02285 [Nanoarchaeota archaeon]|nr:hypothetical protein [Nanoarchaeota archaeon]